MNPGWGAASLRFGIAVAPGHRRAPFAPTVHQLIEYAVSGLLLYVAIHRTGPSAAALIVVAAVCGLLAALSPGALALRELFGPVSRRIGDMALVVGCLMAAVVAHHDLVAVIPLVVAACVLARLGLSRVPPARRSTVLEDLQPAIDRTARAAGAFVRSHRRR